MVQPATRDLWIPWPVLFCGREAKSEGVMTWGEREKYTGKGPDDCCCLAAHTKRPAPHNQTFYRQRKPLVVSRKDKA